jgi:hypothetical protein
MSNIIPEPRFTTLKLPRERATFKRGLRLAEITNLLEMLREPLTALKEGLVVALVLVFT